MPTLRDDVVEVTDYAWARLRHRLIGLTDDEWAWLPTADPELGLRWRLAHIGETLRDQRNAQWLGRAPGTVEVKPATSAEQAVAQLEAAFAEWRGQLAAMDDVGLRQPVGPVGGSFATSTRHAFALHILDELIHHGAEAALLRDLYRGRYGETDEELIVP